MMEDKELESAVCLFFRYLTVVSKELFLDPEIRDSREGDFLSSLSGFFNVLPYGFIEYLEKMILNPLDKLSLAGFCDSQYRLCKRIIDFLKSDRTVSDENNPKKTELSDALNLLLNRYQKVVSPNVRSIQREEKVDEDGVTKIFNDTWKSTLEELFSLPSNKDRSSLNSCVKKYHRALSSQDRCTRQKLSSRRNFFSNSVVEQYPYFFNVLQVLSEKYCENRTHEVLMESVIELTRAYHIFFRSISEDLLGWLITRFGKSGEKADRYQTYFCMIKSHITMDQLLGCLRDLNLPISQSLLCFLDTIKEEIATVAFDAQDDKLENYSLFKACYSAMFTAVTEAARTHYSEKLASQSKEIEKLMRSKELEELVACDALPEKVLELEKKIDKISGLIKESIDLNSLPRWLPKWLGFMIRFVSGVIALFVPRLRRIKEQRIEYVNQCVAQAKDKLRNPREAHKKFLFSEFKIALYSSESPLSWHTVSLFSKKQTRIGACVQGFCEESFFLE
jgi:hypothetical protein